MWSASSTSQLTSPVSSTYEGVRSRRPHRPGGPPALLVTGAGPIGLLAALLGVQRELEAHVLDRVARGPKVDRELELGASYHEVLDPACMDADIVIECTGAGQLVIDVMRTSSPNGVVCLTGISSGHREIGVDAGALSRSLVLENAVVFGSVNANLRHYAAAARALEAADPRWLESRAA
jgi:threonine dehydrogenase-like Zn-dependent dehydrogenase